MAKYAYPAVFSPEGDSYSVSFPDLEGCYTCGDDLTDAVSMAADALALMLWDMEEDGRTIPAPSHPDELTLSEGEFFSYIFADTTEYRKKNDTKAVKRTVSLPRWLDVAATAQSVNFSQVLQNALKEQLHLA